MKPLAPVVEEQTGRLHIPGTTVEVTAPQGDYSRPKSKPRPKCNHRCAQQLEAQFVARMTRIRLEKF
jgi:hypothetical protein